MKKLSNVLFRYSVISVVLSYLSKGIKRGDAIRLASVQKHLTSDGYLKQISSRSIQRWLSAYEKRGISGLKDAERKKCEGSEVLKPKFLDFLKKKKTQDPWMSIPELIYLARETGILHPEEPIDRTTVWRALCRMKVPTQIAEFQPPDDQRPFAYPERMQMVLVDFKHFRAGPKRVRRVAIYFLDDSTRLGLGLWVGTKGEQAVYCLKGLYEVIKRYGLMDAVYMDRGPAFKAHDVIRVMMNLGVLIIQGKARYPEGHGKIERFNRSLKSRSLRSLSGNPSVDPDPGALNLRLRHDLYSVYNHRPHEGIGKNTPHTLWNQSKRPLRPVQNEEWLRQAFTLPLERKVRDDNVIYHKSIPYEVPTGLKSTKITLYRALLEDEALYFQHHDKRIKLHPADLAFNATSGRSKGLRKKHNPMEELPETASNLSFEREYNSILDKDGGFIDPDNDEEENHDI